MSSLFAGILRDDDQFEPRFPNTFPVPGNFSHHHLSRYDCLYVGLYFLKIISAKTGISWSHDKHSQTIDRRRRSDSYVLACSCWRLKIQKILRKTRPVFIKHRPSRKHWNVYLCWICKSDITTRFQRAFSSSLLFTATFCRLNMNILIKKKNV